MKFSFASLAGIPAVVSALALVSASPAEAAQPNLTSIVVSPMVSTVGFRAVCATLPEESVRLEAAIAKPRATRMRSAILGGEESALERIRAQQSGEDTDTAVSTALNAKRSPLQPAANGVRPKSVDCNLASATRSPPVQSVAFAAPMTSEFLASRRVPISQTAFDRDWARVGAESVSNRFADPLTAESGPSFTTIEAINRWVNREIHYVEDRELYGRADYWAGARLTMALRKGDCEDIALTKMQMLAAAGLKREDMFLTIARDTVRRADHALLVVRVDGRFVVLDNTTDRLLDGAYSHDYLPVLSFASSGAWVHGSTPGFNPN